jgi:hypothetical protein
VDSWDLYLGQQNVPNLAAGQTYSSTTLVNVPSAPLFGTYYLIGVADSTSVVFEYFENNNTRTVRLGPFTFF